MIELADFPDQPNGWTHYKSPWEREGRSLYSYNDVLIADVRYEKHCTVVYEHEGIHQHDCLASLDIPDGAVHFINKAGQHYASHTYKNNKLNGPSFSCYGNESKTFIALGNFKDDQEEGWQHTLTDEVEPLNSQYLLNGKMAVQVYYGEEPEILVRDRSGLDLNRLADFMTNIMNGDQHSAPDFKAGNSTLAL